MSVEFSRGSGLVPSLFFAVHSPLLQSLCAMLHSHCELTRHSLQFITSGCIVGVVVVVLVVDDDVVEEVVVELVVVGGGGPDVVVVVVVCPCGEIS